MADDGHLHKMTSMPEINTVFLFTIALEIQYPVSVIRPMADDASFISILAALKDRS